jgi:hypothetical protein
LVVHIPSHGMNTCEPKKARFVYGFYDTLSKDHFGVFKNSEKNKKIIEKSSFKSLAALSSFFWIFSRLHFTLF